MFYYGGSYAIAFRPPTLFVYLVTNCHPENYKGTILMSPAVESVALWSSSRICVVRGSEVFGYTVNAAIL